MSLTGPAVVEIPVYGGEGSSVELHEAVGEAAGGVVAAQAQRVSAGGREGEDV